MLLDKIKEQIRVDLTHKSLTIIPTSLIGYDKNYENKLWLEIDEYRKKIEYPVKLKTVRVPFMLIYIAGKGYLESDMQFIKFLVELAYWFIVLGVIIGICVIVYNFPIVISIILLIILIYC